jgi:hypothetical protein
VISNLRNRLRNKNARAIAAALSWRVRRPWHLFRVRSAPEYPSPTDQDMGRVEQDLRAQGIQLNEYQVDVARFREFMAHAGFPPDYHGGVNGGVYLEKMLEHFVAWDLLDLGSRARRVPYVDIAGASSPWASLLRAKGIEAMSIDLELDPRYTHLDYYIRTDATATPFAAASIGGTSLQCAFEMFQGDADTRLIGELARILRPGGRTVISPLYMHTHACCYQSPEHYGRRPTDAGAKVYVRRNARRVPSSRKYSAATLLERVWRPAIQHGLVPSLHVLRNRQAIGGGLYLHFILVMDKPGEVRVS